MARIRPFVGLLYDTALAGPLEHLTTPPYDVIDERDRERYHDASPFNVIRLIRGRDLPGDDDASNRYTRASQELRRWRSEGVLVPTSGPAVFPYEFHFHDGGQERIVRGIVAAVDLEPFGHGVIAHERTMAGPERDRLALLRAVRANLSAVHAVYRGPVHEVRAFLDDAVARPPAAETTDAAGTRHRLWVRHDADEIAAAFRDQELMIADGHHRYSVALGLKREMNDRVGPGAWDRMMMLLIDAATEEPPVLPVHRAVLAVHRADRRAGSASTEAPPWRPPPDAQAGERVRDLAEILATLRDETLTIGSAWFEDGELIHRVMPLAGEPPAVRALHDGPLRSVGHGQLAFLHDAVGAEEMVRAGEATAAFFLPPTRVEAIRQVIAEGDTLPEKSTYFWPKPLTGMVVRPFDP